MTPAPRRCWKKAGWGERIIDMTVSRRDLFLAGTVAATIATVGSVSACLPASFPDSTLPGQYTKVKDMRLLEAGNLLSKDATLVLATTMGVQNFVGAKEIGEAVHQLLAVEGFALVGDQDDINAGGMYWRQMGPWLCSDLLKGGAVELGVCDDGLSSSVFNVLAHVEGDLIKSLIILENRNLTVNWSDGLEQSRNFGE